QSWRQISYDHSQTKFPLEGKHKTIACRACHGKDEKEMKFVSLPLNCSECHEDIHRGQFVLESHPKTECSRCHTSADWKPEKFAHNRDTAFKLDGAHLKVACTGCHKQTVDSGKPYIKFKPLDTACNSCHSDKSIQGGKS
ncbi:MAG TPA: cytochrome C, partial [candidate division Zixibacteria bacterium]|nr:cytochrome C [candidate division Zixibacteria bacterium]